MTNLDFRPSCGLSALLWHVLRQLPQGESVTVTFSLNDARLGLVELTVTLLEEVALTQRIGLDLTTRWPNRLQVTRQSDTA
jgi:hypothetical protein